MLAVLIAFWTYFRVFLATACFLTVFFTEVARFVAGADDEIAVASLLRLSSQALISRSVVESTGVSSFDFLRAVFMGWLKLVMRDFADLSTMSIFPINGFFGSASLFVGATEALSDTLVD